jgi:hypothetical protein
MKKRARVLALTIVMYMSATSHWALNLSSLISKVNYPESTEHNINGRSFAVTFFFGFNVRLV